MTQYESHKLWQLAAVCALLQSTPSIAADWPSGYSKCANEGASCKVGSSTRSVSFGAKDKWVLKDLSGTVACSVATFGSDPIPGTAKKCAVGPAPAPAPAPGPAPAPAPAPAPSDALSSTSTGEGTYYDATGAGACSFDASPNDLMVAAMNSPDWANSGVCGEYVKVTGPKGTVTVRIVDLCPECKTGDLDFSPDAFSKIADLSAGRVAISWYVVAGAVEGPVSYKYKEGSSRWWTALQVRNHKLPITKLEILPNGSATWINVPRTDYNYFVYDKELPTGSITVRITALGGATLMQTLPEPSSGLVVQGQGQFP